MNRTKIIAVFLCALFLMSSLVPLVNAAVIEIDIGGLFDPELDKEPEGEGTGGEGSEGEGSEGEGSEGEGSGNTGGNTGGDEGGTGSGTESTTKPSGSGSGMSSVDTTVNNKKDEEPKEEKPLVTEFSDVKEKDWFYNDVTELAKQGIVNGYDNGSFKPQGNVTRAEFVKLIVSLFVDESDMWVTEGEIFDDVKASDWHSKYIVTAMVNEFIVVNDYGTQFKPDEAITRKEVAKISIAALNKILEFDYGKYKTPFSDTADHNAIGLYRLCLMQGSFDAATGKRMFYPKTNITRAEVSAVINRMSKLLKDPNGYVTSFKKSNPTYTELKLLYTPVTVTDFYKDYENAWENSQAFLVYGYEYPAFGNEMSEIKEMAYEAFI